MIVVMNLASKSAAVLENKKPLLLVIIRSDFLCDAPSPRVCLQHRAFFSYFVAVEQQWNIFLEMKKALIIRIHSRSNKRNHETENIIILSRSISTIVRWLV